MEEKKSFKERVKENAQKVKTTVLYATETPEYWIGYAVALTGSLIGMKIGKTIRNNRFKNSSNYVRFRSKDGLVMLQEVLVDKKGGLLDVRKTKFRPDVAQELSDQLSRSIENVTQK